MWHIIHLISLGIVGFSLGGVLSSYLIKMLTESIQQLKPNKKIELSPVLFLILVTLSGIIFAINAIITFGIE
ncbi:MAG: hypothetical protein FWG63_01680 [Defluviitaleaceae bacterium]|nr:hypothetical protein [Defluviitaleaceae bacterium]